MPMRPLLRLPTPNAGEIPGGPRGGENIRFPGRGRQRDKFAPLFNRLRTILDRQDGALELRDDATSLAPERVIVFEIAGTVTNFLRAVGRIHGLEFMAEYEGDDFAANQDFAVRDTRRGREGRDRTDSTVPARFLSALNAAKHERTILSPAESLNALTVGAQHHDHVHARVGAQNAVDPFVDDSLPNVSSGLGLGYRRMVKPEVFLPGGREYVRMTRAGVGLTVTVGPPQRLYGLRAAAPDPSGQGRLDYTALSDGTSSATALATRSAHRIFDALMDRLGGSMLADMDPQYYAVVVKCLLVHSAKWNGNHELLKEICGPADRRRHVERAENSCRFIGFGVPDVAEALECAPNRATLVGHGEIEADTAQNYRIPLPGCLERVRPRP